MGRKRARKQPAASDRSPAQQSEGPTSPEPARPRPFASRAGEKLSAALDRFRIDPDGLTCADLGCNVGGFTDCLLQRGAEKVYAVDTGYGELAWRLRKDPRVVVMERTNALHVTLPEPVSLVVIDVGWTRQARILPAALRLLGADGFVISLIKPHYEADKALLRGGVLSDQHAEKTVSSLLAQLPTLGVRIEGQMISPLRGQAGNSEYLVLLRQGRDCGRAW